MPGRRVVEDNEGVGFFTAALVLLVVFAIVLGIYFALFAFKAPAAGPPAKIAEMSDQVKISYTGFFEDGLVFDTSVKAVGDDNATWPKALSFEWRPTYADFEFVVGKTDCSGGQTDCAITGMWEAVLGHREEDTVTHTITPDKGYGQKSPNLVTVKSIREDVPVREVMNTSAFQTKYRSVPVDGVPVVDPFWGWTVLVHVSQGLVTVENSPEISRTYPLYLNKTKGGQWSVLVESIDDAANNGVGAITILNRFTFLAGPKLMVEGSAGSLFITENDDGTYTIDSNREVVGVNLVFSIKIITITKAS